MLIKKKLLLTINLLVSVPLVLLSILIYYYTSSVLINNSKNNIVQITNVESNLLISLINQQKKEVELSAQREGVVKFLENIPKNTDISFIISPEVIDEYRVLKERANGIPGIQHSFIIDLNGTILSDSDAKGKMLNVKDREYFKNAINGKLYISNTLYSKIDNESTIVISSPVKDKTGKIIGVFANSVYTEYFEKFTSNVNIGNTGYAYIVDNNGLVIAHPNREKVGKPIENSKIKAVVDKIKNSQKIDINMDTYNYDNKDKFVAINIIPDVKWTLCIAQDIYEINAGARNEFYIIIGVTFFMLLVSVATSITAAESITVPIENLIKTMNKASKGDLSSICEYKSKDEFGQLSNNFNTMIKKLNLSYEELSAVYEELSATDEELRTQYDELIESQKALSLSEERYRQVLDGINDIVWEWDMEKNSFFVSDKFYHITGYSIKNINIKKLLKIAIVPEDQKNFFKDLGNHIKMETSYYRSQFRIFTVNGDVKWILNRGKITRNHQGKAIKFFGAMTDVTDMMNAQDKIKQLAYYDSLTELPNRTNFLRQLDEELKLCKKNNNRFGAVLFIDLDDFKKVNDSLGHDIGDKLLKAVSDKLNALKGKNDVVCRFGGDEFLILRKNVKNKYEVEEFVLNLLKLFENKFDLGEKQIFITGSIGISMFPRDGEDNNIILKNSDTAMYKAKEKGKNRYQFYNEDMSKRLIRNMIIEKSLRNAITTGDVYLQYQPQIEIKTGKVIGKEALIRLKNDELGFLSPLEFIPIAERTGLIIPIGEWIMKTAYTQNIEWIKKGYNPGRIAINVSSVQINQPDFVEKFKNYITETHILPESVELEITETVLMESLETNVNILRKLRDFGVRIALDDFGTGYSSLNYLRIIPINTLKIDKSFIDDICFNKTQDSIVEGIIQTAHKIGIEVVAEGVETSEQLRVLRKKQCDIIQGYIFSKPLFPEGVEDMMKIL